MTISRNHRLNRKTNPAQSRLPIFPPSGIARGWASPFPFKSALMKTKKIVGQPSWILSHAHVKAALTQKAGHLGPIQFRLGKRWIAPYDLAPWAEEKLAPGTPDMLRVMRGDFFCMPFGGNETPYRGEKYPPHGETANASWKFESGDSQNLHVSLKTKIREGRVDKLVKIVPGQTAVYVRHIISGMKGQMSFGHHAILKLPGDKTGRISTSRFRIGQVFPGTFEHPLQGGYSILKPGAKFHSLREVPRADGQNADLSVYPDREGYEDLVMMGSDETLPFAWTALVVAKERYVWFALKDPRVLRSTVFWMSNGGRHYAPWNGRHRHAIGLEEVTSNFHYGLAESVAPNVFSKAGISTSFTLSPRTPLVVNYIMALAEIPSGFDVVKTISAAKDLQSVTLISQSGKTIHQPLDVSFTNF